MTPSDVRDLRSLELVACYRPLRRWERRRLEAWERSCAGALGARHWPPLPTGRRCRALERLRRVLLVMGARSELAAALVRRVRALVPPLSAEPTHGPRCGPGCADCAAIWRWRREYEVLSIVGAAPNVRRLLFP